MGKEETEKKRKEEKRKTTAKKTIESVIREKDRIGNEWRGQSRRERHNRRSSHRTLAGTHFQPL